MEKKVEVLVRFANESVYYNKIKIDPSKIEDPMVFTDEVFVTIDGVRVAMKKEDWDNLKLKENEQYRRRNGI
jgi:hypothetical protein